MKPESQRIAIAAACGWTQLRSDYRFACGITHSPGDGLVGISPINSSQGLTNPETCSWVVPDYLNSLDAMHEVEKVLSATQLKKYHDVLVADVIGWSAYGNEHIAIHATAAQRAEAFLRTLNLWTDET